METNAAFFGAAERGVEGDRERRDQDQEAKAELIKANLRLVISIAKNIEPGLQFLD